MGLGPSGGLPHCYIVFTTYILAINRPSVCVCVIADGFGKISF